MKKMKKNNYLAGAMLALMMNATSITNAQWQLTGNSNATTSSFIGTTTAKDFVIKTGGSASTNERMRVLSTGNVGIGLTAPASKLHVYGTGLASLSSNGAFTVASSSLPYIQMRFDGNHIQATGSYMSTTLGTSLYLNPYGGRINIGNSSEPDARLFISADAGERAFQVAINSSTKFMVESNGGASIGYGSSSTPPADGLIVNGKTGIGKSSPEARLHVNSGTGERGLQVQINGTTKLMVESNGGTSIGYTSGVTPPTDGLLVSGTVNIGSQSGATGYKLAVEGKVICEELKVQMSDNWPDYVFADDYKLASIDELEKSINENKHLPGIPSASEVKENGLSVGDMQRRMMEKIEELSLYIIDLKHQKDELSTRVAQLENK